MRIRSLPTERRSVLAGFLHQHCWPAAWRWQRTQKSGRLQPIPRPGDDLCCLPAAACLQPVPPARHKIMPTRLHTSISTELPLIDPQQGNWRHAPASHSVSTACYQQPCVTRGSFDGRSSVRHTSGDTCVSRCPQAEGLQISAATPRSARKAERGGIMHAELTEFSHQQLKYKLSRSRRMKNAFRKEERKKAFIGRKADPTQYLCC